MAVFKCKMCGGAMELTENMSVGVCPYCGTTQTFPRIDDEKRTQLYDRANYFRRENEFDKAMGVYEMILGEDSEDCESYWGIVLCRYGIEYVEDPQSHKRIPTVNRAQFTSIFDDADYKKAITYADAMQRGVFEAEAQIIDDIQKGILSVSQKEEPFDIFICYKETDSFGNRTQESVYAQDIYYALTNEGYKVFFSRITLEDKLGSAYEPYIFAALNSAKVMLVVGTNKDNFNAVWVKNEWSRYLGLIKQGKEKILIPVYKDITPYDMPEEFQYLQSQDMGKIGFLQDLMRGIEKFINPHKNEPAIIKETVIADIGANVNIDALLKRVTMFIEDGDWRSAKNYCEKVLDVDPESVQAYLGKLMVDARAKTFEEIANYKKPLSDNINYQKIVRFGDAELVKTLEDYNSQIEKRNLEIRGAKYYAEGIEKMKRRNNERSYKKIAALFESISGYKDADSLAKVCYEYAEYSRKDAILVEASKKMTVGGVNNLQEAVKLLQTIPGWRDADDRANYCKKILNSVR